ncbi:MAG: D-alanyl-D-alanine carboxypeptidase [Defluviitaleaceae bacterium]|nr:D-alanyl-D-alanine carboxypeptidase [Defluviitaleaceae bacterium]MCL2275372.1 D-alanyl-D-alanine carboxypeptidase [Defluviitaleaceae bacterium]
MKYMKVFAGVILAAAVAVVPIHSAAMTVDAKASILMEAETGRVLQEDNAHEKLAPASVTKVMTMLLIYEALDQERIKWDDIVTVSAHAASMGGSQVYLEVEEKQSVRDLTKAIVIASANDAAVAMAEFIAGSEDAFVTQMNKKAKDLGMENTHFVNACGLDADGHLTTAYDIALMSRELMLKYPEVVEYATTRLDSITHKTARGEEIFGLTNTNKLLRRYPGVTGLKTGSTGIAKYCMSATAEKEGMQLIAVVLAAPDPTIRFDSAVKLLDYGYANYALIAKEESGTPMGEISIYKGKVENAPVVIKEQTNVLAPKGKHIVVDAEVQIDASLTAPVAQGQHAGVVIYTHEGEEVGRSELIIQEEIARASAGDMMERIFTRWLFAEVK